MQNFRRGIITLVGILSFSAAQAQKRFQPGYIVLQRGDTVRGIVEAPTRSTVARGVLFRKNADATDKVFYPVKTIRAVGLTGGKSYVMHKMQPVMKHDTLCLLLEPLAQGRANLYRSTYNPLTNNPEATYANQFSFVYYYIERPINKEIAPYLLLENTFREALRNVFSDCLTAPVVTGKFNEQNLLHLVQQYNTCSDSPLH